MIVIMFTSLFSFLARDKM